MTKQVSAKDNETNKDMQGSTTLVSDSFFRLRTIWKQHQYDYPGKKTSISVTAKGNMVESHGEF